MAMLTLKEAGIKLGFKYITMWTWIRDNKIPFYKINGSLRIDEEDVSRLLRESRQEVVTK